MLPLLSALTPSAYLYAPPLELHLATPSYWDFQSPSILRTTHHRASLFNAQQALATILHEQALRQADLRHAELQSRGQCAHPTDGQWREAEGDKYEALVSLPGFATSELSVEMAPSAKRLDIHGLVSTPARKVFEARALRLPFKADPASIELVHSEADGLLTVRLSKAAEPVPLKLAIAAAPEKSGDAAQKSDVETAARAEAVGQKSDAETEAELDAKFAGVVEAATEVAAVEQEAAGA